MRQSKNKPIKVALYGMDHRTCKALSMYLSGPCKGIAIVVDESESDVDILDADFIKAKDILDERKSQEVLRPLIVLSIEPLNIDGTIYVKKPIQTIELIAVFKELRTSLNKPSTKDNKSHSEEILKTNNTDIQSPNKPLDQNAPKTEDIGKTSNKTTSEGTEKRRTHKHRTAMDITEANYSNQIGSIEGLNFNNRTQMLSASHNPDEYFLGYVKSAIITAKKERKELLINSHWKPVLIFPATHEIWVDSKDIQLRAFASLPMKTIEENDKLTLLPTDSEHSELAEKTDHFNDMNAFIWKLAIWTSKGRYPDTLDINKPVYLMHWPNYTRLVITPHAIRIAALLIRGPRSPINISDALKIQPHFVFVFISAAHSIGLIGQAVRQVDNFIDPPEIKKTKTKKGLLNRILSKLRT